MSLTLQRIQQLTDKERRQLHADINYFNSKMYSENKRKKRVMTAIQEIENEYPRDIE